MGAPIGNSNASKENRRWAETLNRAIAQDDSKRLRAAAEALLDQAAKGDLPAIRELADRLDGKPHQTLSGPNDSPLIGGIDVTLHSTAVRQTVDEPNKG
jgi:hypothetical protein